MTFKEWEDSVKSERTIEVSREVTRDIYKTPNGINLMHDVTLPHNFFKKQTELTVVDYTLFCNKAQDVNAAGGTMNDEDYYTSDGYGVAVFRGEDSLEKAYNFSQTLK